MPNPKLIWAIVGQETFSRTCNSWGIPLEIRNKISSLFLSPFVSVSLCLSLSIPPSFLIQRVEKLVCGCVVSTVEAIRPFWSNLSPVVPYDQTEFRQVWNKCAWKLILPQDLSSVGQLTYDIPSWLQPFEKPNSKSRQIGPRLLNHRSSWEMINVYCL